MKCSKTIYKACLVFLFTALPYSFSYAEYKSTEKEIKIAPKFIAESCDAQALVYEGYDKTSAAIEEQKAKLEYVASSHNNCVIESYSQSIKRTLALLEDVMGEANRMKKKNDSTNICDVDVRAAALENLHSYDIRYSVHNIMLRYNDFVDVSNRAWGEITRSLDTAHIEYDKCILQQCRRPEFPAFFFDDIEIDTDSANRAYDKYQIEVETYQVCLGNAIGELMNDEAVQEVRLEQKTFDLLNDELSATYEKGRAAKSQDNDNQPYDRLGITEEDKSHLDKAKQMLETAPKKEEKNPEQIRFAVMLSENCSEVIDFVDVFLNGRSLTRLMPGTQHDMLVARGINSIKAVSNHGHTWDTIDREITVPDSTETLSCN